MNLTENQRAELAGLFAKLRTALEKTTASITPKLKGRTASLVDELAFHRDALVGALEKGKPPEWATIDKALIVVKRLGATLPTGPLQLSALPWAGIGPELAKRVDDSVLTLETGDVCKDTVQRCADTLFSLTAAYPVASQGPQRTHYATDPISKEARLVISKLRGRSLDQVFLDLTKATIDPLAARMALNWARSLPAVESRLEDADGTAFFLSMALRKFEALPSLTIRKCSSGEQADANIIKDLQAGFDLHGVASEIQTRSAEIARFTATQYYPPRFNTRRKELADLLHKQALARRVGMLK